MDKKKAISIITKAAKLCSLMGIMISGYGNAAQGGDSQESGTLGNENEPICCSTFCATWKRVRL